MVGAILSCQILSHIQSVMDVSICLNNWGDLETFRMSVNLGLVATHGVVHVKDLNN